MTTAAPGANAGLVYGWAEGEDNWDASPSGGLNGDLAALDALIFLSVISSSLTAPPGSPAAGDRYVVGASATGAWATHDLQITRWNGAAWEFYAPKSGWRASVVATGAAIRFDGAAWQTATPVTTTAGTAAAPGLTVQGAADTAAKGVYDGGADILAFGTKGVNAAIIDAAGNLIIGATAGVTAGGAVKRFEVLGNATFVPNILLGRFSPDTASAQLQFSKSRAATIGGTGAVVLNDVAGQLTSVVDDGTSYPVVTKIVMAVDGAVSTGVAPGRIVLSTSGVSGTLVEALRVDALQNINVGSGIHKIADSSGNLYAVNFTGTGLALVNANVTAAPTAGRAGTVFQIVGTDAVATFLTFDNYGASPQLAMRSAKGTAAAPTASLLGDIVFNVAGYGHTGAAFTTGARANILGKTIENWGTAANGAVVIANATPAGSITAAEAFRVAATGLFVGSTGTLQFLDSSAIQYLRSYTRSTLPTSGYVAGQQIWCSDLGGAAGGGALVNTGSAWKRANPWNALFNDTADVTGAVSYVYLTGAPITFFSSTLTGNLTVTLSPTDGSAGANTVAVGALVRIVFFGALAGHTFSVVNGGGSGGSKLLTANQYIDEMFDGANWIEIAGGTLI